MNTDTTFQQVIVIGYGKVTGEVLQYVYDRKAEYGYDLAFIEHEVHPFSITEKICSENGIPFERITDKKELAAKLDKLTAKTLIISASNNFLFPSSLVDKPNVTIINFHNALLPDYPGRNAPTWVIYMGEKETGITWHYVTAGVDEGNIIVQKRCEITEDMKAYELTEQLMNLAGEAFKESFADIMAECVEAREQGFAKDRRMYRSYEVPADGLFELTGKPEDIYRLLRSVDYGKNDIFPPMRTVIDGREVEILRYRKIPADKAGIEQSGGQEEKGFRYLPLRENTVLKLKYVCVK
ncbi:MAG: hypothetical protein K2L82_00820 [Lachnospiraceae bacterium]|nr:hypothetical protein [Lachnospiraceae bacterium]